MTQRLPELDGLRGVAAYIVVVSHISNDTGLWGGLLGNGGGQLGVMIFFCLSGYLMGALYLDRPFVAAAVGEYAIRRVARVIPLFYVAVLASLAIVPISNLIGIDLTVYPINTTNIARHLGFVSGDSVFWTVPVEVQFYAAFIPIWLLHHRFGRSGTIGICIAIPILLLSDPVVALKWPIYAAYFLSGVAVSRLPRAPRIAAMACNVIFFLALSAMFLLYPRIAALIMDQPPTLWSSPIYLVVTSLILVSAVNAPLAKCLLGSAAMRAAGAISYSLYLLHMVAITYLLRFTPFLGEPTTFLAIGVIASTVVASCSYFAIERPARRYLSGLGTRQEQPQDAAPYVSAAPSASLEQA